MRRWLIVAGLLVAMAMVIPQQLVLAHSLCFADKTPFCLQDPFSDYWEANGGLPVFGYPIAAAAEVNADTGQTYLTQWIERNRMEDHPENAGTPYRILLGLLGKERLAQVGRDWRAEPRESGPRAGCLWFPETGHNVCNQGNNLGFKRYWETHGLRIPGLNAYARSLQLFGMPLTEPKMETNSSGDTVLTQWFERARFEWHPNNPDNFKVLLGLLGKEVRGHNPSATTTPTGTQTAMPTGTQTPGTQTAVPTGTQTAMPTQTPMPTPSVTGTKTTTPVGTVTATVGTPVTTITVTPGIPTPTLARP